MHDLAFLRKKNPSQKILKRRKSRPQIAAPDSHSSSSSSPANSSSPPDGRLNTMTASTSFDSRTNSLKAADGKPVAPLKKEGKNAGDSGMESFQRGAFYS